MTDAENQSTTYAYDDRGTRVSTTWPDHQAAAQAGDLGYGIETVAPDAAGRPEVLTRQDGTSVTLVYDLAGRTIERQYRDFGVALGQEKGSEKGSGLFFHAFRAGFGRFGGGNSSDDS